MKGRMHFTELCLANYRRDKYGDTDLWEGLMKYAVVMGLYTYRVS
jgi:hypothetical protein